MTPADLSRLESLAREATPGPWMSLDFQPWKVWDGEGNNLLGSFANDCDGAYIAAANPAAVLALIERARELEGKLEAIRDECDGKADADDGIPNTAMRCMMIVEGTNKP
jgi:hypothetical protein